MKNYLHRHRSGSIIILRLCAVCGKFTKELGSMCNLSQGIVEDTERETTERFIMSMYDNDIAVEKIAVIVKKNVDEVQAIIENNQAVLV
jgi:hypothetical protein